MNSFIAAVFDVLHTGRSTTLLGYQAYANMYVRKTNTYTTYDNKAVTPLPSYVPLLPMDRDTWK